MNNKYKFLAIALTGVLAVGCNDLDTEPLGGTVTSAQKEAVLENDPSMAEAGVYGLPMSTKNIGYVTEQLGISPLRHDDFGFASLFLGLDSRGIDMIGPNDGYNWYSGQSSLTDWGGTYFANINFWYYNFSMIKSANTVAMGIPADTENPQLQYYRAQAQTFRAYAYFMLANMYQRTYAVNPDAPCVPVITDENMDEAAVNGSPRATVAQVYEYILKDLTDAIELFGKAKDGGVERPDRRFACQAVAYGLRARAYLTMQDYANAASDAQKAISLTDATPVSISEAGLPGYGRLTNSNFMWGIQCLVSEGFTQGVNNFASMMGPWMSNGYCSVGCSRRISKKLYAMIPQTDVRRNLFLDGNATIPASLPSAYVAYIQDCKGSSAEFKPYTNLKYAADGQPGGTSGAIDVPMMRVEEMYLILAEAEGMQSPAQGASTLQSFVRQYRDAAYTCTATTKDEFREAIWYQRRIELWGEGFSYFDLMRYEKGIDRVGCGFPPAWVFVVSPDNAVMRYQIPQSEVEANPLLNKDNVEEGLDWVSPEPVTDKD